MRARDQDEVDGVGGPLVDPHVRGEQVERHVEAVARRRGDGGVDLAEGEGDEVVVFEDDGERGLGVAVLVGEDDLGHERELVLDGVNPPLRDILRIDLVLRIVAAVAEVEAGVGAKPERAPDALNEGGDAWGVAEGYYCGWYRLK